MRKMKLWGRLHDSFLESHLHTSMCMASAVQFSYTTRGNHEELMFMSEKYNEVRYVTVWSVLDGTCTGTFCPVH